MAALSEGLLHNEESERLYAVQDILALDDGMEQYAEPLVRQLGMETSQAVRDSIVFALKRMACTHIFPMVFELFQSGDAYLRNAAAGIFSTKETEGVAFLTSKLDHADREVRKLILDALFQIGSRDAVLAIRAGLQDPSINVRITAVEYLGQLNDKDSLPDVFSMLAHETDPMLITSALETVLQIGDETALQETIRFLNHNDDILKVHPVFLPELIKLIAKSGTLEHLLEIISLLNGRLTYAKDIVMALGEARTRHKDILCHPEIIHRLIRIVKEKEANQNIRYAAAELLLADISCHDRKALLELGETLVQEPAMVHAGIHFLGKSETKQGRQTIQTILAKTKDYSLNDLCGAYIK